MKTPSLPDRNKTDPGLDAHATSFSGSVADESPLVPSSPGLLRQRRPVHNGEFTPKGANPGGGNEGKGGMAVGW